MKKAALWDVVRKVAPQLGIEPHEVRLWKHRGKVPGDLQVKVLEAARDHGVNLTSKDFEPQA